MPTFEDFLKTGAYGPIEVGVLQSFVQEHLGEPFSRSMTWNPETWRYQKYPELQLSFYRDRDTPAYSLVLVGLYFDRRFKTYADPLEMSGWIPSDATTIQEFAAFLGEIEAPLMEESARQQLMNIAIQKRVDFTLLLDSGVKVVFENSHLSSIQYMARKESEKKQLSITIGKKDWELIHQEAASLNLSVPALCAKLITEHAHNLLKPVS